MSEEMTVLILVGILFVFLAVGLEIGLSLGLITMIGFLVVIQQPVIEMVGSWCNFFNSFVMTAVPLFVFMGAIFLESGITTYLFDGVNVWLGRVPGGLGISVIGGSTIFSALCGSSAATAAAIGTISIPAMEKYKYDPKLALGVVAVGGTLGILIPPSINMIVFGAWTGVSVVDLFAAGVIPGLMLAILFAISILVRVMLNPSLAPKTPRVTWRERLRVSIGMIPWILTVVVVLGVIFSGIMTPTEAASMGAVIALVLALLYRRLSFRVLRTAALTSVRVCAMIGLVAGAAIALVYVVRWLGVPQLILVAISDLHLGKYGVIALVVMIYIIMGMFVEGISLMLLTLPFLAPVITAQGYSLLWFGIFLIICCEISFLTPPVGMNLYVVQSIAPKYSVMTIARGVIPFMVPMILIVVILVIWPEIVAWLPSMLH